MPPSQVEKKRVTLLALLRWCYTAQMVHLRDSGPDPRDDIHLNGRVRDSLARLDMQGHGSIGAVPLTFHPDAEIVHEAVLGLGEVDSQLVIEFGRTGRHPEPIEAVPRPMPFSKDIISGSAGTAPRSRREPDPVSSRSGRVGTSEKRGGGPILSTGGIPSRPADHRGTGFWRGEWTEYRIAVAEVITERRPVFVTVGRGKTKISHYETTREEVLFTPVEWWPSLAYVEAVNGISEHWQKVMRKLAVVLAKARLIGHEIASEPQNPALTNS